MGVQYRSKRRQVSTGVIQPLYIYRGDFTPSQAPEWVSKAIRGLGPQVWIDCSPDDGTALQTAKVQAQISACRPGQTAVLPPPVSDTMRFVRCDDITFPAGVNFDSAGSQPLGWTIMFSPSISQAFNSRLGRIWMKQCKLRPKGTPDTGTSTGGNGGVYFYDTTKNWIPNQWKGWFLRIDSGTGYSQVKGIVGNTANRLQFTSPMSTTPDATSVYSINCSISAVVVDGTQFDGTNTNNEGSTVGNCIELDNLAYDFKFLNGAQIWNYYGTALGVYGNPDRTNNTGVPYIATGVFVTGDHLKIFNCGLGLHARGGPKDGASLHFGKLLIDHCSRGFIIDDSVNGNVDHKPEQSGGITLRIDDFRCELNGYVPPDTLGPHAWPSMTNTRGTVHIGNLWFSSSINAENYKNIHHRRGKLQVDGGRLVKGANTYGLYCEPGLTAVCDWESSGDRDIGRLRSSKGHVGVSTGTRAVMRFELTKTAGGITMQHLATDGRGWGTGTGAGDQFNTSVSADLVKGGATQSLGGVFDKIHYQWMDSGIVRIYPEMRTTTNVLTAVLHKESTALTRTLSINTRIQAGDFGFRVEFYAGSTLIDLANNAQVPVGSKIEFSVEVAMNDINYQTIQVPAIA